jgi:hypothetical protein
VTTDTCVEVIENARQDAVRGPVDESPQGL